MHKHTDTLRITVTVVVATSYFTTTTITTTTTGKVSHSPTCISDPRASLYNGITTAGTQQACASRPRQKRNADDAVVAAVGLEQEVHSAPRGNGNVHVMLSSEPIAFTHDASTVRKQADAIDAPIPSAYHHQ